MSTNSLIVAPVTPLPRNMAEQLENTESEAPFTAHLFERRKHMENDYQASKVLAIPHSDTYFANKTVAIPNSDTYRTSKPITKPKINAYRTKNDLVEALPEERYPQVSKPLRSTLWLAFALSGIVLLLGTVILYALVPSHSPGSSNHVNSNPTAQPSVQVINTPVAQPSPPIPATGVIPTSRPRPIPTPTPTPARSYEADAPQNILFGGASVVGCPNGVCSDGKRVGYIGLNNGEMGVLQFNNVSKNIGGKYTLTIYYFIAGQDKLTMYINVNGGSSAIVLNVPTTPDGNTVGTVSTTVSLNAGNNTIAFCNPSVPAPDMDRIVV